MKFKVTVTFEVEDNDNFKISERIERQGKDLTEQDIMHGFLDPEFINPKCTIEEIKCADCNGTGSNESGNDKCPECKGK